MRLIAIAVLVFAAPGVPLAATDGCPAPVAGRERWDGQNQWRALQNAGYTIGAIRIRVDDVYDTPAEDPQWYERAANKLHINSSKSAIRAAVTVEPGERVDANRVYQAERICGSSPTCLTRASRRCSAKARPWTCLFTCTTRGR